MQRTISEKKKGTRNLIHFTYMNMYFLYLFPPPIPGCDFQIDIEFLIFLIFFLVMGAQLMHL